MPKYPKNVAFAKSNKKATRLRTAHVRIIAGEYRHRLVSFIEAQGLRPTPDRLRETLFNWLQDDLPKANVLDCCAGSGILGFEALSRGAAHVTLIEPKREQFEQIIKTINQLRINPHKITPILSTAQQALPELAQRFDVVFLDPPYQLGLWQELLGLLQYYQLIHALTIIYIETNQPSDKLTFEQLEN